MNNELFSKENCVRGMYDDAPTPNGTNEGCIGIIRGDWLKAEYRTPENQLFRIRGGFGATPDKIGNAVFGEFCTDGEGARIEKYDFLGIANEEVTKMAEEMEKARRSIEGK